MKLSELQNLLSRLSKNVPEDEDPEVEFLNYQDVDEHFTFQMYEVVRTFSDNSEDEVITIKIYLE